MSGAPERVSLKWICSRQASVVFLAIVLLAVLGLSLAPHPEAVLGRLSLYDKAGHFAAYIVLGSFSLRAINRRGLFPVVLAIASCAVIAAAIAAVPSRRA